MLRNAFADLSTEDRQEIIEQLLTTLLSKSSFPDPSGRTRVAVEAGSLTGVTTVGAVTTVTGVTTVGTVSNSTSIGGLLANADQFIQMQIPFSSLRQRIIYTP